MKKISTLIAAVSLLVSSCVDDVSIAIPFEEPSLVIDGVVSSTAGSSYVTLSWTFPTGSQCHNEWDLHSSATCPPDTISGGTYLVSARIQISDEFGTVHEKQVKMHDRKSYLQVPFHELVGTPGVTYYLAINIEYLGVRSSYTSKATMYETPCIEQMTYEIRKGDIGKDDNFVPLISFQEPQEEENYYLFRLCEARSDAVYFCDNGRTWPYSIISDQFLPAEVKRLSIDDGASVARYAEFYPRVSQGVGARVTMYSVTRETYTFYKALLKQFNDDGGTYSGFPTTPPGNLSGGALGLFRALDESSGVVFL